MKGNTNQMAKNPPAPAPKKLETREGLKKNTGDVVGFKDLETQGALYGIPRAYKASDSKLESNKPSIFVIFELLEDTKVTEGSGDESKEIMAKAGEMVGVWVKGGMRRLRTLGGLKTLAQYTGTKRLAGRPAAQDPMKTYQFDTDRTIGQTLLCIEDNRKDSRNVVSYWLPPVKGAPPAQTQTREREPGEDLDDPGF